MARLITGPDTPINAYGFSYGTSLFTYLTAMFPERVNRVVIDGVMAVEEWWSWPHYEMAGPYIHAGLDLAWEAFLRACADVGGDRVSDTFDAAPDIPMAS
jgi:pimeloyl-ACP methyl ester carboxylesterase